MGNNDGGISMKYTMGLLFIIFFSFFSSFALATNMHLFGVLIEPPECTVDSIDIDFGNRVGVNRIDGKNYLRTMDYHMRCDENNSTQNISIEISGEAADYDLAAIVTNLDNLAMHLTQDGMPLLLNKKIYTTLTKLPVLQVVPVKRPGAQLKEGTFEAVATLKVSYQ